jgi:hypothetical protein
MACTTATGFAAVAPLTGARSVAAVGSVTAGLRDVAGSRAELRAVLQDQALLEGHDAESLLHHVNARLAAAGIGALDAVVLLSHPAEGLLSSMTGVGWPAPLVVTPDRLTATVRGSVQLRPGWTVVLGGRGPTGTAFGGMLSPADVQRGLELLAPRPPEGTFGRTLLAIAVER